MFKLSFKQLVLTGFAISLLFVFVSAIASYFSVKSLEGTNWQNHAYKTIDLVQRIEPSSLDAESGIRGYILSHENKHLEPYTTNVAKIGFIIRDLKKLVSNNAEQSLRVDSLEFYVRKRILNMQSILQSNVNKGKESALTFMLTEGRQILKNKILSIGNTIIKSEYQLLAKRKADTEQSSTKSIWIVVLSSFVIFGLILFLFYYIKRTFDQQKLIEAQIKDSNLELEKISAENQQKNWLLLGATLVNEAMRGEQEIEELATNIVTQISNYIGARIGAFFLVSNSKRICRLVGGYAYTQTKNVPEEYHFGEGLIGQAALEKQSKLLENIPADYIKINSSLGDILPTSIYILPVIFKDKTIAVIELGLPFKPDESVKLFLGTIAESIGVALNSAKARIKLSALFQQTQQQAEELESQQEELRTTNEELLCKSEQLQVSEEELRVQQEELRQINVELEEKASQLEERNILVNQAREAMSLKAEELEISSKYKSEFLANMSHELRTPLNSILILARILKENKSGNLNDDQIKYAGVIHTAGSDLLTLNNDILDLSKIESGKIDLSIERVELQTIKNNMETLFNKLVKTKKIKFNVLLEPYLPELIMSDQSRIEQIIKNLLSNAFKFTPEHGQVTLNISTSDNNHYYSEQLKNTTEKILAITVKDSGIGIPEDKLKLIFEAFHQADGSITRKHEGTGLGLSISKELANLLGGEIQVQSKTNEGSTFTLFIPQSNPINSKEKTVDIEGETIERITPFFPQPWETPIPPPEEQTLLIVEDDLIFADVLNDYALEKGFKTLLAHSGDVGLELALSQRPDAIVLDIMLPVMDGWAILKKLKADPLTKYIPVHMMSAGNEKEGRAKQEGAIGFLRKPIEKKQLDEVFDLLNYANKKYNLNKVLVIEDQKLHSKILTQRLLEEQVEVKQAYTGKEALELLNSHIFDCIILDLNLPDISGFDLLDKIKRQPGLIHIPVIINTAMELDDAKMAHIMKYSEAMVLKSNKSNDRLIDEVSLFMNKLKQGNHISSGISSSKSVSTIEKALKDKTILITDDDMRNVFAISSALQGLDMHILIANNGKTAISKLEENDQIDLILMDIMKPREDRYEVIKMIRNEKRFAKIPIIALTAEAMENDSEKYIEAGANDYISKPIDMNKLLSMLRVWLS